MIVVCAGMIRSGSTLQFNIAKELLRSSSRRVLSLGFLNSATDWDELIRHSTQEGGDAVLLAKAHDVPADKLKDLARAERVVRLLYVDRDIRDVAASAKVKWSLNGQDLVAAINKALKQRREILRHPFTLRQSYSRLHEDTAGSAVEIAAFLGMTIDRPYVEALAGRATQIGLIAKEPSMRQRLKGIVYRICGRLRLSRIANWIGVPRPLQARIKSCLTPWNQENLYHECHQSSWKGAAGAWKTVLSPDELLTISAINSIEQQVTSVMEKRAV